MSDGEHSDELSELPPSALLVYRVLEEHAPLTQQEICAESHLCARTTRHALRRLEEYDLIESEPDLSDARQQLYSINA